MLKENIEHSEIVNLPMFFSHFLKSTQIVFVKLNIYNETYDVLHTAISSLGFFEEKIQFELFRLLSIKYEMYSKQLYSLNLIFNHYKIKTYPMESQLQNLMSGLVLKELGFQLAPNSNIPQILRRITPTGGTAFRDSLISGCNLLIKLYQFLSKTGAAQNWNFVQVILTDGADENSKTSLEDTVKVLYAIGKLLNVKMIKIILIGVGVSAKAEQELKTIAKAGGENAEYYSVDNASIQRIFQRITVNLGLQERNEATVISHNQTTAVMLETKLQPFLSLKLQNFAVLFNLDVSGSMAGQKWKSVCESVDNFIDFLGEDDLVSGLVFNDETKMLSKMDASDKLFQGQQAKQQTTMTMTYQGKKVEVNPEECQIY